MTAGAVDLELVARPIPLFMIGDSHTLVFSDLVIRERASDLVFVTRAKFCRGVSTGGFLDPQGSLLPIITYALTIENILDDEGKAFHLSRANSAETMRTAAERRWGDPVLVFFAGDIDLRSGFLKQVQPHQDFELPFEVKGLDAMEPVPDRQLVPARLALEFFAKQAEPFLQAMAFFARLGFQKVFVHELRPPTLDDAVFERIQGFRRAAIVRYKATALFNYVLRHGCERAGVRFLEIWNDVTVDGRLDPAYELDGVHLNRRAAMITLRRLLEKVLG